MSTRYPLVELIGGALSLAIVERVVLLMLPGVDAVGRAARRLRRRLRALDGARRRRVHRRRAHVPPRSDHARRHGPGPRNRAPPRASRGESRSSARWPGSSRVWLPFGVVYKWIRGRVGMGLGDAKLIDARRGVVRLGRGSSSRSSRAPCRERSRRWRSSSCRGRSRSRRAVRRATARSFRRRPPRGTRRRSARSRRIRSGEPQGEGIGQSRLPFGPFLILGILECLLAGGRSSAGIRGLLAR